MAWYLEYAENLDGSKECYADELRPEKKSVVGYMKDGHYWDNLIEGKGEEWTYINQNLLVDISNS